MSLNALQTAVLNTAGGDYTARPALSTSSGAYMIPDDRWDGYGGVPRAADAPPAVQDEYVRSRLITITEAHHDLNRIAVAWYAPDALKDESLMGAAAADDPAHRLTPLEYQTAFAAAYSTALAKGAPPSLPANDPTQPYIRQIAFPVAGHVSFYNDWQACRDDCARLHEGIDFIGAKGQLLRAATDGTITAIRPDTGTISGAFIEVTDADGWRYVYRHVNNDTPGTDDGQGDLRWAFHPALEVGSRVRAGQVIGYMGNSGNAESSVPHLHFEIRLPSGVSVNPFPSVLAAQQREQCTIGVGPWSTLYDLDGDGSVTADDARFRTADPIVYRSLQSDADRASDMSEITGRPVSAPTYSGGEVVTFAGENGTMWDVTIDGLVEVPAAAAMIVADGECVGAVPTVQVFGSFRAGVGLYEMPSGWLDEEPTFPPSLVLRLSSDANRRS